MLGECVQALKNYKPSINLDDFIMCSMRGLSEQILEDVIKQEEKREKA